jgi:hypothetical protein
MSYGWPYRGNGAFTRARARAMAPLLVLADSPGTPDQTEIGA